VLALLNNLLSDLGPSLPGGTDVSRDFMGFTGPALSVPLPFMVLRLICTLRLRRQDRWRLVGAAGVTFFGLLYVPAQAMERIGARLLSSGGFDLAQGGVFVVNVLSAAAMLVLGILSLWGGRATRSVTAASH
jgi:hypothetical protein